MKKILLILIFAGLSLTIYSQLGLNLNKPERIEEMKDAGFGIFIHWGVDVQLGGVISHELVGASEDYINKYITDLPQTFFPMDWNQEKIVILAKNAGMKYIVLTAKHHSGFCLWCK
jgi:alpha-L-fucosidase